MLENFHRTLFILVVLIAAGLTACGGDAEPTAPPPLVPTALVTIAPATRAPTAASNATIPTTTPSAVLSSAPSNTCPFTGLPLNGVDLATRRPLLIKIGNSPPERPQSGLAQADIVVEHLTEGAITRFSAILYCSDATAIGPIRSARLIDLEMVPMFGAIFAHVGGSEPVRQMIAESEIAQADFDDYGHAPIFREVPERKRPFNRYTSTQEMYALAAKKNLITGATVPAFAFDAAVPSGGHAAATITIPYRKGLVDSVFTYQPASGLYQRGSAAAPQLDAVSNQPLTAANVLVLYAPHETTTIVEDSLGSRSLRINLMGTGNATLLRDGQAFDVTWMRTDPHALFQFTDAGGKPIALKPGNLWMEVAPLEMQAQIQ